MKVYFDTSTLVKLYYPEPQSVEVASWLSQKKQPVLLSALQELELKNALCLKVFWGHLEKDECQKIIQSIDDDIDNGALIKLALNWNELFSSTFELSAHYSQKHGLRSLDILHVASALQVSATHFLTFDERQAKLAKKAGLKIVKMIHSLNQATVDKLK